MHFNNQQAEQHFEIYGFHEGRLGTPSGQISLPTHPGNTINSAFSFGVINGSRSVREFVGSSDDCYRFTLGNISNFSLTLNGLSSNADVQLLDGNGNTMTTGSYNYGTKDETIGLQLNPGTYYIKVYSDSRVNTNYNLTVSATPTPPSPLVFNSAYGYGLVDAGAAVARAIGQSAFANTCITNGIHYAADHGANVINLSLGSAYPQSSLQSVIQYASSKGVVVVMAAGNDSGMAPGYPARYAKNSGLAVGAVDQNKNMADFSNRAGIDQLAYVTAPGVNIYSTVPGNKYAYYSGTSMATPYVTGVVALMLSANPSLTAAQIRDILISSACLSA